MHFKYATRTAYCCVGAIVGISISLLITGDSLVVAFNSVIAMSFYLPCFVAIALLGDLLAPLARRFIETGRLDRFL